MGIISPLSTEGAFTGATQITMVSSPSNSNFARVVSQILIHNPDSAAHEIRVRYVSGGSTREIFRERLEKRTSTTITMPLILDGSGKSIVAVSGEDATTTEPNYVVSYYDREADVSEQFIQDELQGEILKQMKIMNMHLALMTDCMIEKDDVREA